MPLGDQITRMIVPARRLVEETTRYIAPYSEAHATELLAKGRGIANDTLEAVLFLIREVPLRDVLDTLKIEGAARKSILRKLATGSVGVGVPGVPALDSFASVFHATLRDVSAPY